MSAHSSKRDPIYVALVDGNGNILGTSQNPLAANSGSSGDAQPEHVLEPHTFENIDGLQTGTMKSYAGTSPFQVTWVGGYPTELRVELPTGYFEANNPQIQVFCYDPDYTEGNIAAGKQVFGLNGSFTSDADATAEDIRQGKTAYVNGVKITGTGQF